MNQTPHPGQNIADLYAAALFALAQERNALDAVRAELEALAELVAGDPGLAQFLDSAIIDTAERARSLERMFRGRLSDLVVNTLQVMNAHGRAGLIAPLLRAYVLRLEDARGQVAVRATSAVPLDAAQQAEVRRVAEALSGSKPLVEFVVDPAVLGGLVLEIGDLRYDYSIRRHLHDAAVRLRERGERGVGVRPVPD